MNRAWARALVRLYPRAWRDRYGAEFAALLEDERVGVGAALNVMASALSERTFPTMGGGMHETPRWQRWSTRAPWAVFCVAPVALLACDYCVALLILWTGWRMFLPAERTPFVPVAGWAIAYFGIGRAMYFFAPMIVGVLLAWAAVRAQAKALWPLIGATALALVDSVIQVQAVRPSLSEAGTVHLKFADWHPGNSIAGLALAMLAYWLLRIRRERTQAV